MLQIFITFKLKDLVANVVLLLAAACMWINIIPKADISPGPVCEIRATTTAFISHAYFTRCIS